MPYEVVKQLRVRYTLDADTPEAALAAEPPADAVIEVLRQRARDTERKPSAGRPALQNRELRIGRKLIAKYKGTEWVATVEPDGQISLRRAKGGSGTVTMFPTLAKAATSIIDGKAVNAWFLFRDAEPVTPVATPKVAKPSAKKPAAKKVEAAKDPAAAPLEAKMEPAPETAPEPTAEGQAS
jgi:hypothetical protein